MKRFPVLLGALLLTGLVAAHAAIKQAPAAPAPQPAKLPVHLTTDSGFALQGNFNATYELHGDSIAVDFKTAEIKYVPKGDYLGRRQVLRIRVGLAHLIDRVQWDMATMVVALTPDKILAPGETYKPFLEPVQIPLPPAADLAKHWFVIELQGVNIDQPKAEQQPGTAFAHSSRTIFLRPPPVRTPPPTVKPPSASGSAIRTE